MIALVIGALTCQGAAPQDAAKAESLMTAGQAHFAGRIVGRYPALAAFREAARLCPSDPEPLYWQMKVGFYLRSFDGEWIVRDALLQLFEIAPDYRDAWQRFHEIYQSPGLWRHAERALAKHGEHTVALARRAELLIALNESAQADSLLTVVVARGRATAGVYLLRGAANFLAGRAADGFAWHDSAVARADTDSAGALWQEAWIIASPGEEARHATLAPGERRAFFERFWAVRDPNLLTPENERIAEHYARCAEARRTYRLLHPQRTIYHSKRARALLGFGARQELRELAVAAPGATGPSSDPDAAAQRVAALSWTQTSLQDTALPRALRAGLTAQGLVFMRYGRPDQQAACVPDLLRPLASTGPCVSHLDEEAWLYWTPRGPLTLRFQGNEYLSPATREQLRSSRVALQTDRTAVPAPLEVRAWSAAFRSTEIGLTDVYFKALAGSDSATAILWGAENAAARAVPAGGGVLQVAVPRGRFALGLDVDSAGKLGRLRQDFVVPYFSRTELTLSSLVLAPGSTLLEREAALRGMPADLTYRSGVPLVAYVEVYGLAADERGLSRYRVRYSFAPQRSLLARLVSGGARPVVFEFERVTTRSDPSEQLVIEPDKLPPGRYRLTLLVSDLLGNVKSESAALVIEIR